MPPCVTTPKYNAVGHPMRICLEMQTPPHSLQDAYTLQTTQQQSLSGVGRVFVVEFSQNFRMSSVVQ